MTSIELKKLLLGTTLIAGFTAFTAAPTFAQDAEPIETTTTTVEDEEEDDDEVVVTGSRLKKDTFQSIVPLQVIDTEIAADSGLLNPVEILQTSSVAGGTQIDSTFQGFVLDNGPGSETVDLRGLGASRTLVMINGRRMAPAGVEGAPTQPSINLLPSSMIESFDLLTDGASSVYGSDAVAGVINVILDTDYDGLEVSASVDAPEQGSGEDYTLGAKYGISGDRGFIGGAIEYDYQDAVKIADRDFLAGCDTYLEETESGELLTQNLAAAATSTALGLGFPTSECIPSRLTQRFIAGGFGSIYYQPGTANSFVPGFSESTLFGVPIDGDGDGVTDVRFHDFSPNGKQGELEDLFNQQELWSGLLNAEYTFEGEMNITPYFEGLYSDLKVEAAGGQPQLFPFVPANNPTNPCNINQPNGVDCNAAYNALLTSPGYLANFQNYYTNPDLSGTADCFGLLNFGIAACDPRNFGLLRGTGVSLTARPVIGIAGDRTNTSVDIAQARLVGGVKGDLPFINSGDIKDWSFDVAVSHSWSEGNSSRMGIREDRLNYALGWDPVIAQNTGQLVSLSGPCAPIQGLNADIAAGCVPVDLFATSLYENAAGGDFATTAERNYLFDSRDFSTDISQTIIDGIVQGDIFSLPGGDASILLGAQIREDRLDSTPDNIARDGLFFGFFSDGGAAGERTTKELYGEAFIPLGQGVTGFKEFNLELAGRLTDDEFYGTNETFSVKAGWRPVDALLLRGTIGTSFRAPNLRELFLRRQSGFGNVGDPCGVPEAALGGLGGGGYDRSLDPRTDITLDNCRAVGIDPETFLANQSAVYSVESAAEGNLELDPETSDSFTVGASFEQPFTDAFDLELGVTYYEIEISDSVVEPSAGFIVNECYSAQPNQTSPFCNLISRDFNALGGGGRLNFVDRPFLNRDLETAKGVDINARFGMSDIQIGDRSLDFAVNSQFNHKTERDTFFSEGGTSIEDSFVGEFGFSDWQGFITPSVSMDNWRLTWSSRYIGGVQTDLENQVENNIREDLDPDPDVIVPGAPLFSNFNDPDSFTATCAGPDAGSVNCRPIVRADDYWNHSASLRYTSSDDTWSILAGVSNVFNKKPPLVDGRFVFSRSNVPLGNGYDLNGREFFVTARKTFN